MKVGCRIRTSSKAGRNNSALSAHPELLITLRFPTDSKTLSSFSRLQLRQRRSPVLAPHGIGPERAFTEAPENLNRVRPKGR
jgi:hypothetical protein